MNRRGFLSAVAAVPLSASPGDPAIEALADPIFADLAAHSSPGCAVAVLNGAEAAFAKGYGLANLDEAAPITAETVFHLASLSKQFTAGAVALLALDGRLDLEAPVLDYVPEAARYGADLRIAHLIYMTSGLHEYTSTRRLSGLPWQSFYYFTRDEAIERSLAQPALMFTPGTAWSYSNVNYMILSRIVEAVSGASFADFMQGRVFGPLGMRSSFIDDDTTRVAPSRAVGYAARTPELQAQAASLGVTLHAGPGFARLNRVSPHFGGSGVFSTLNDLARWNANWTRPMIGGPDFPRLMTTTRRFAHDKTDDAFGLVMGRFEGRSMIWYSGGDLDSSTWMARFPDNETTLICLSNLSSDSAERRGLALARRLVRDGRL